ncbi:glypican-1 [Scleropages formosus]|uniref:Glypican-1 n=1 Tax=Scleropages formosus TaxID=113540 RepID=A0A8C9SWH4_SCLFO|nr:glypican-1-like [Scleropages formosus]
MDAPAVLLLCFLWAPAPALADAANGKARNCADMRSFYSGKGFAIAGIPNTEISGEHLRICPQGYTCCTSEMEESLSNLSRREFEGRVKESGRALQGSLYALYRSFDGYFVELLNASQRSLQDSYREAHGTLFAQNARVFQDLYDELRRYYRGARLNLEEALNEFWARLMERLFRAANLQYTLGDEYLDCAAKQMETLRPFGDAPHDLHLRATRTFVAARSLVQGLTIAGEVVRKVSQVPLSLECNRAIMKLMYCPHCRGVSFKPCANYCRNVMKGCLANQADLHTEWQNLLDTMMQVVNSFNSADSGLDVVLYSIPRQISEGIINMQENMETFSTKVFQACGNPRVAGTGSTVPEEPRKRGGPVSENKPSPTNRARLEKVVSDMSSKLRERQQYWVTLPTMLCGDKVAAPAASEDRCWNGMTRGRYLPQLMGDGLASQINNPEVEIDITKPDMTIRQQIMQLKVMTNRLKNAFNGNDVDFQDASDDVSGSGSGMYAEESPPRGGTRAVTRTDRPKLYAYQPDNKKVTTGTGSHASPSSSLLFLSVAALLFRR